MSQNPERPESSERAESDGKSEVAASQEPKHPSHSSPRTAVHSHDGRLGTLALGALGVVYGDIGTSPLYAVKECFHGPHALALTRGNVFGILSLVFWALIVVISIKYLLFVMRADNRGEGGILALMALVPHDLRENAGRWLLVGLGLFGAALLYGDGIRPGTLLTDVSIADLAPTLLYLLGLPVARDLDGQVITAAFDTSFLARRPLTFLPSYENLSGPIQVIAAEPTP